MGNANASQSPETDAGKEAGANREADADRKARAAGEEETQGGTGPRPGSSPGPDSNSGPDPNSGPGSSHGGAGRQTETSPPGTGRAGDKEESGSSARARPTGTQPSRGQRDWDAFAFQHEKLKHLTTVGLVLSGGIITLFQSEMMEPSPPSPDCPGTAGCLLDVDAGSTGVFGERGLDDRTDGGGEDPRFVWGPGGRSLGRIGRPVSSGVVSRVARVVLLPGHGLASLRLPFATALLRDVPPRPGRAPQTPRLGRSAVPAGAPENHRTRRNAAMPTRPATANRQGPRQRPT